MAEIFWPGPVIFHAHWFGGLSKSVNSPEDYRRRIDDTFCLINEFRQRTNASLAWTAHNLLPHNSIFPDVDVELRRKIIEEFDVVHFMDERHERLLYELTGERPRASFCVSHPHYSMAQPDFVTKNDARNQLGLDPSSEIVLFFGSIQRYKGLDQLVDAFRQARSKKVGVNLRLVIAGYPSDPDYVNEIHSQIAGDPLIRFFPNKVADEDLQLFFRSSNAVVLPYNGNQLNSGAAMLALTFGIVVIAPNEPAFTALTKYGLVTYDKEAPHSLVSALCKVPSFRQGANDEFLEKFDPDRISGSFFDELLKSVSD
ncbi:MAG: glycosyltransferase [Cyanobacteria bacterium J06638_22]